MILSYDASPYAVGTVLAQLDSQGREALIEFASRTGPAAKNYSQLDKGGQRYRFCSRTFPKIHLWSTSDHSHEPPTASGYI